jgi:hypothetical protein
MVDAACNIGIFVDRRLGYDQRPTLRESVQSGSVPVIRTGHQKDWKVETPYRVFSLSQRIWTWKAICSELA